MWRVSQTGAGVPLEGFLEEELSALDLEGFMPEGQSGGFYKKTSSVWQSWEARESVSCLRNWNSGETGA